MENKTYDDRHFETTSRYVSITTYLVLIYVLVITFIPIPKESQRFVDTSLGFLLSMIAQNASYLVGGNPNIQRKPTNIGETTAKISATITKIEE